jgi:hypothetical protein
MASKRVKDGPHWVKAWISELSSLTDQFRDIETGAVDFEALGREEYHFRMALSRRDFSNSERARKVWEDAVGNYQQRIKAASKDKNPQDATNGNAVVDCKSRTSCDQLTADGDTREDSLNITTVRKDGKLESGTSANLYGDASTRESEDASTTVSKNMRRVPQNEAPAHGFSGGRAAQGTMSRPPEAAAQSGKPYDQVAYHSISTDEKPAGGHLLPSSSLNGSPVGNRHSAVDVLNLAYAGEFGNVRLTQEQYAQLGIKFGNQQKLNRAIDSLSCQIENGEKKPANHYAELVKWANYRDDMEERKEEEASKPKMTEMEKSWIEAMKRVEAM